MEKEQYREFFKHLKGEGLLIPQIDEESFDEYIFDNFKAVLPQANVIKSVYCREQAIKGDTFKCKEQCDSCRKLMQ